MTNQQIFNHIENRNSKPILEYFSSFSTSFYFFFRKQYTPKFLSEHQIQAIFDDACILMYDKIESKNITLLQMTSSVKTMIFGIGKNMASEEGRNETKYHSLHLFLENSLNDFFEEDDEEDSFFKELQMKHLEKALSMLSLKHHALIVEGVIEEKSNIEIAREQGYNSGNAVAVEKIRALKILKQTIFEIQKYDDNWER